MKTHIDIRRRGRLAFTLIELLVVISIISLLTSILLPSLSAAREMARAVTCLSNLHSLGAAMGLYQTDNNDYFWPYRLNDRPAPGQWSYWWGSDADPVDPAASPFMNYCGDNLAYLWCPSMKWGTYIPQGWYVSEPTTTYGYNAYYLDPDLHGKKSKNAADIPKPSKLFVFNDSAMRWRVGGRWIFQNSTYLEPVSGNWTQQPTSHFRHRGRTNALCADGHAEACGTDDWKLDPSYNLGFVGMENDPHYAQQ